MDTASFDRARHRLASNGRRITLAGDSSIELPLILSEFGGVKLVASAEEGWGYTEAATAEEYEEQLRDIMDGVRESELLAGWCYTQLTDTGQEVNELLYDNRSPKLPMDTYRDIFGSHT